MCCNQGGQSFHGSRDCLIQFPSISTTSTWRVVIIFYLTYMYVHCRLKQHSTLLHFLQSFLSGANLFLKAKKVLPKASRDIHLILVKSFEVEKLCAIMKY